MLKKKCIVIICLLMISNNVLGIIIPIKPDVLVKGTDIIILAQIINEKGMINKETITKKNEEGEFFHADTEWEVKGLNVIKNITGKDLIKESMVVITPGSEDATVHMGSDLKLGEIGDYVLLFLKETHNQEEHYIIDSSQQIIVLKEINQKSIDKVLNVNNVKVKVEKDDYYINCFNEINRWIKNVNDNKPVYIFTNSSGKRYQAECLIKSNYTYITLRDLEHVLGVQVNWKEKTHSVEIKDKKNIIKVVKNSKIAYINNLEVAIDMPLVLENGKSYLPIKVLTRLLGKNIDYFREGSNYFYTLS